MCIYLTLGIILFGLVHLYPAAFATSRAAIGAKIGHMTYKGIHALLIILSLVMIVYGWQEAVDITMVYTPPAWGPMVTVLLMFLAVFLFISARAGGNIKRLIRHPQLSSIILWGVAHLLSNGDSRSVTLFGAMVVWAILQMFFLNRRDGAWQKPDKFPILRDIIVVVVSVVIFVALMSGHAHFTGVPLSRS